MPRTYSEYRQVFRLTTLQRGRPTALALSPTRLWLCSATDAGDLMVLRSSYGRILFHVEMGRQNHVTALTWATDLQIILGCASGAVYTATLRINPPLGENRVQLTNLLHDEDSAICAVAWDSEQKLLAIGYADHVSVQRRIIDRRPRVWETVDTFDTSCGNLETCGQVHSLWFFGAKKSLVVGLDIGTMVWFSQGNITAEAGTEGCRIGAASLSSDNSLMAVSTRDQSVIIWPVLPEGPITRMANTYLLESGREWGRFESRVPVALTPDHKVVCGTLDGTIAVLAHTGLCLQKLKNEGLCTRMIVADENMIYATFTSAVDATTIIVYCNDGARRSLLQDKFSSPEVAERDSHLYLFQKVYSPPNCQSRS
ncbi:hypothetical protein FS749_002817 [Ceratobasidium sp. UAMH 11750]|nr:hypothetical protein FS749_002817 [Ceratobasidium sp. UAMH 11750]